MNSQIAGVLIRYYQVPIIGDLTCCVGYAFMQVIGPLNFWLIGYKRMKFGTSVIWAGRSKKQVILDGIECLRNSDPKMFLRFTQRQRLIIYYSYNRRENNTFGRVFGLGERYTQLGAEGVASFIVQALLFSDASPHINQSKWRDRDRVALKSAPRQTVEWMREHSFHPKLVDSYLKVAEKWEQSERFREIASLPANSD